MWIGGKDMREVPFQEFQRWRCLGKTSMAWNIRNMEPRGMSAALT